MKVTEPRNKSTLLLQMFGLLIVVILCVIVSIKLRNAIGGTPGTLAFVAILGGLGYMIRRYIDRYVVHKK